MWFKKNDENNLKTEKQKTKQDPEWHSVECTPPPMPISQ